jgi:hypothetical protein
MNRLPVFVRFRVVARGAYHLHHIRRSVRMYEQDHTGRISAKFDIGCFYENLSRKVHIWLKSDKNIAQKYRAKISDKNIRQKYRTKISHKNTGKKYRTKIKSKISGKNIEQIYRAKISDKNIAQKYRTKISDNLHFILAGDI